MTTTNGDYNKMMLSFFIVILTILTCKVNGFAFMTGSNLRAKNTISAFRRFPVDIETPTVTLGLGVATKNESVRATTTSISANINHDQDHQQSLNAAMALESDSNGFGNSDEGVETFRNEMISLVYSRMLDRMDDLSLD